MRIWSFVMFLLIAGELSAQDVEGKKLEQVNVLDRDESRVEIKMLGKEPLLIFYQDPDAAKQNKFFRDSLKAVRKGTEKIRSCAIINFKDSGLPKFLVKMAAKGETKDTGTWLYYDMDGTVSKGWGLGDVNDSSCILLVDPKGVVEFYKKGELTVADKKKLLGLLEKYK